MNIKYWFTGVVEDIADPQQIGRVRVRCFGYHTPDHEELPTEDLPWAQVMLPTTSAGIYGVGQTPTGLQPNSWVFGFFRDGEEMQDPVVIGSMPGGVGYNLGIDYDNLNGYGDPHGQFTGSIYNRDLTDSADSFLSANSQDVSNNQFTNSLVYNVASGGYVAKSAFEEPEEYDQVAGSVSNLVKVAKTQLSVRETSKNQGPGIEKYWTATNYPGGYKDRAPWCAAFVSWCIKTSGILTTDLPNSASVAGITSWASRKQFAKLVYSPRYVTAGDLISFNFASHIGIAANDSDGENFISIDGNTFGGSPRKQGVFERGRRVSQVRVKITLR